MSKSISTTFLKKVILRTLYTDIHNMNCIDSLNNNKSFDSFLTI